ncbi:MAG: N-acyl homoserine lactonase family protein [Gammaproteobacteria bacterium]|nr:N-acyl homoserine lactonase family protein [Gammaproteobacteria bacterium]
MSHLEPFEVYAIRYATVARNGAENFIGGDPHETTARMDYFVWLAKSPSHTFVIDSGFNADMARKRGRDFLRSPVDGLSLLGVDANEVRDLIVTHLHYDHIGNFDLFPKARFHLQDEEMAFATGRYMAERFFSRGYELDEIVAMLRNVYAGRVDFHAGDSELVNGLSLHHVGGHTKGLQVVRVWTRVGWLVLASDASHYRANMDEGRPFPIVFNVAQMFDGWKRMRELADDPRLIVPGHDPLVMEHYDAPSPELEGIAVRLDAFPHSG